MSAQSALAMNIYSAQAQARTDTFMQLVQQQQLALLPGRFGGEFNNDQIAVGWHRGQFVLWFGLQERLAGQELHLDAWGLGPFAQGSKPWLELVVQSMRLSHGLPPELLELLATHLTAATLQVSAVYLDLQQQCIAFKAIRLDPATEFTAIATPLPLAATIELQMNQFCQKAKVWDDLFSNVATGQGLTLLPGRYGGEYNNDQVAVGKLHGDFVVFFGIKLDHGAGLQLDTLALGPFMQGSADWLTMIHHIMQRTPDIDAALSAEFNQHLQANTIAVHVLFIDTATSSLKSLYLDMDE